MATVMLRQTTVSSLSKLLRQTQIRVVKYSSSSDSPEDGKKKLSALLSSIRAAETRTERKEPNLAKPKPGSLPKRDKTGQIKNKKTKIDLLGVDSDELLEATKEVSKLAKTEKDRAYTESALLKKLKSISSEANSAMKADDVRGEKGGAAAMFSDLKVEKREPKARVMQDRVMQNRMKEQQKNLSMEQIAFLERRARMRRQMKGASMDEQYVPTDIYGGSVMGVFQGPVPETAGPGTTLQTWRKCNQRELTLLSTPSPRNALEEFILWTEQGKLWTFPIDNEQSLDYSHEPFHAHIFLEQHLQPWCPGAGPIRHFMELVCVALSKNPYVSVEYKVSTIDWFRVYFSRPEINELLVHQGLWVDSKADTIAS